MIALLEKKDAWRNWFHQRPNEVNPRTTSLVESVVIYAIEGDGC
jgi:hypothetical protein